MSALSSMSVDMKNIDMTSQNKNQNKTTLEGLEKREGQLSKEAPMNIVNLLQQLVMNMSGKGTAATVSPPIMNYWNNRWAL